MLSGRATPHIPDFVFRYFGKLYWWFAHNILTHSTPIGRKVRPKILNGGEPLISVSLENVKEAHVEQLPRLTDIKDGLPQLEDGRVISVTSIVWAAVINLTFPGLSLMLPIKVVGRKLIVEFLKVLRDYILLVWFFNTD
ncbi:MAG TPA: hypothetical protein VJ203_08245 [Bacteroidales bacterium]|nr:hypothetical protein [Bacteroidales bacterium]